MNNGKEIVDFYLKEAYPRKTPIWAVGEVAYFIFKITETSLKVPFASSRSGKRPKPDLIVVCKLVKGALTLRGGTRYASYFGCSNLT